MYLRAGGLISIGCTKAQGYEEGEACCCLSDGEYVCVCGLQGGVRSNPVSGLSFPPVDVKALNLAKTFKGHLMSVSSLAMHPTKPIVVCIYPLPSPFAQILMNAFHWMPFKTCPSVLSCAFCIMWLSRATYVYSSMSFFIPPRALPGQVICHGHAMIRCHVQNLPTE